MKCDTLGCNGIVTKKITSIKGLKAEYTCADCATQIKFLDGPLVNVYPIASDEEVPVKEEPQTSEKFIIGLQAGNKIMTIMETKVQVPTNHNKEDIHIAMKDLFDELEPYLYHMVEQSLKASPLPKNSPHSYCPVTVV